MSRRVTASELRRCIRDSAESQQKRARGQGIYAVVIADVPPHTLPTPVCAVTRYESFSEGGWRDYAFCVGAAAAAKEAAR